MNILFLVRFYQPFDRGGSEWSTHDLAKLLVEKGHNVTILTPNYGTDSLEIIEGISIIRFPFPIKLRHPKDKIAPYWTNNIFWFLYTFLICLFYSVKNQYQIIHVQNNEFIPSAALTSYLVRTKTIVTFRDYQALCPLSFCLWHSNKVCSFEDYIKKDFKFYIDNYLEKRNLIISSLLLLAVLRSKLMQVLVKFFARKLQTKVAVSLKVRQIFEANGIKVSGVIHNPVIVKKGVSRKKKEILFIGKFSPGKGVKLLSDTASSILQSNNHKTRITFIGSGILEKKVRRSLSTFVKKRKVFFTGHLNHEEVLKRIRQASLVVVPSVWPEPLPRTAIESILSTTPVVATNTGGTKEVIGDNLYGILSKPDPKSLESAIIKAIKKKNQISKNILKNYTKLEKHFSEDCANHYIKFYES